MFINLQREGKSGIRFRAVSAFMKLCRKLILNLLPRKEHMSSML